MKILQLILLGILLSGCSGLLTSNSDVRYFYVLNPIDDIEVANKPARIRLSVQKPLVPDWLDSENIILLRTQNQVDYYAEARWVSDPSNMIGLIITESLLSNRVASNIFYDGVEAHADYVLITEVIAFGADYNNSDEESPVVHVKMQLRLVTPLGVPHYQFVVESHTEARANNMAAIIDAFDDSMEDCLNEIVRKTVHGLNIK